MIKLMLNLKKHNNYGFFCPVSKIHLTVSNPIGNADRITSYILRGIKSQSLIDVDNVIDLATGELKEEKKSNAKEAKVEDKEPIAEPVKEPIVKDKEPVAEPVTEDKEPVKETPEAEPAKEEVADEAKATKKKARK